MIQDFNKITKGIVHIVSDLIGPKLSQSKARNGRQVPSVIVKRNFINQPEFPYVTVDHIAVRKVGNSHRDSYTTRDGSLVTVFESIGSFLVEIYGGTEDDTLSLVEELRMKLSTAQGLRLIDENLLGTQLIIIDNPVTTSSTLSTEFREVSRITIDLAMLSVFTDSTSGCITGIDLEGYYYTDFNQLEKPTRNNTNVQ